MLSCDGESGTMIRDYPPESGMDGADWSEVDEVLRHHLRSDGMSDLFELSRVLCRAQSLHASRGDPGQPMLGEPLLGELRVVAEVGKQLGVGGPTLPDEVADLAV